MSAVEQQQVEAHSSVEIKEMWKGEPPAIKVKACVHDLDQLDAARDAAIRVYNETVAALRPRDGGFAAQADALERERLRS